MSILSSEHYKGVIFNFEENRLSVSAANPDLGEAREDMEIEYSGEKIEIAFNPRYFIETVNVIEDERIVLSLIDGEKPCLIKGNTDKNFISVIMPMRI
jgi:DNA polymerase-3 subunit beta